MATLGQLKDIVTDILKDSDYINSRVIRYLNASITEIAAGLPSTFGSFLTPPLPNLFTIDTIITVTNASFVAMPTTFQRSLVFASNSSGNEIAIANSWIEFAEINPLLNKNGNLSEIIELGGNLYYQKIPTIAEDIILHFYRLPIDMVADDDEPDGIPVNFHDRLIVNYTIYKIFERIGVLEKADYYKGLFLIALRDFELSLSFDTRSIFLR